VNEIHSAIPAKGLDQRAPHTRVLDATLVVLAPGVATRRLAAADFEVTKQRQPELLGLPATTLAEHQANNEAVCRARVHLLRSVHAQTLLLVGSAVAFGFTVSALVGSAQNNSTPWLALASVCIFAWATLARLGWRGQSIKGDTAIERIDDVWFRMLYWVGTALATLSAT
jgi:hypothetical protein